MLTKRMSGIGYVEPYQVASTVIMSKHMPRIGYVDKRSICRSVTQ